MRKRKGEFKLLCNIYFGIWEKHIKEKIISGIKWREMGNRMSKVKRIKRFYVTDIIECGRQTKKRRHKKTTKPRFYDTLSGVTCLK